MGLLLFVWCLVCRPKIYSGGLFTSGSIANVNGEWYFSSAATPVIKFYTVVNSFGLYMHAGSGQHYPSGTGSLQHSGEVVSGGSSLLGPDLVSVTRTSFVLDPGTLQHVAFGRSCTSTSRMFVTFGTSTHVE